MASVRFLLLAILAAHLLYASPAPAATTFDWATVGNAGNAADPQTGRGAVSYEYRIATTEVTNAQYTAFLNAVDPTGADPRGLYRDGFMDNNFGGGGIFNTGTMNGARYSVTPGFENLPTSYIDFFMAVRFANWMHNGQHGGNTETGAYTLLGGTPIPSNTATVVRNPGARYFLPSQDEWYKAAYHNASAGTSGVYFDYATGTNTIPFSDNPGSLNTPNNSNVANFFRGDGTGNTPGYNDGYAVSGSVSSPVAGGAIPYTNVGAYTLAASPYGTFDQNGNVREWNDDPSVLLPSGLRARQYRGGDWNDTFDWLHAQAADYHIGGDAQMGFRIASLVGVPDPINYVLTVEYRTGESSGPLIEGFDPLPETLTAVFTLRDVLPFQASIGLGQVQAFQMNLPNGSPTAGDLDYFQLALDAAGTPQSLEWGVNSNGLEPGLKILNNNFTLDISGTDPDSGEEFRNFWSESTNTFAPIPEPATLALALLAAVIVLASHGRSRGVRQAQPSGRPVSLAY